MTKAFYCGMGFYDEPHFFFLNFIGLSNRLKILNMNVNIESVARLHFYF